MINTVCLLVFLFLLVVTGVKVTGGKHKESLLTHSGQVLVTESVSATESLPDSQQEDTQIVKNEEERYYDEIVEAIDVLLSNGTTKLYQHYPVDESFFLWLESRYGIGTVSSIAEKMLGGKADSNLWYQMTGCTMHVLWLEFCKTYQYQTYRLDHVTWKDASDDGTIVMDFVGDINFDPTWETMEYANRNGGIESCISEEILEELKSASLTMVNNEFCYTKATKTQEGKAYSFKTDPENVKLLELMGTDIVSLANNHTCDYGEEGLLETMDTLKEQGIVYSGAGRNLAEASAVRYFVIGGRKIAIVSATEIERFYHYTKKAGANSPGVLKTQQKKAVTSALKEARANSDYVIMFVHWGAEGKVKQDATQRALALEYAKAGADAIIGSHPHRLQGVEFVEGVPVVYSLGNFWFSTGTLYATIAQIRIDESGNLDLGLLPCIQNEEKTQMLTTEEERKSFYQYVADLSDDIYIDEDGTFSQLGEQNLTTGYRSGVRYGQHFDDADLMLRGIDVVGNLQ